MINSIDEAKDLYYNELDLPLSTDSISDATLIVLKEKLTNRVDTMDSVEDIEVVISLSTAIYEALSSPNYYINRKIDVSSKETQLLINNILDKIDEMRAMLKISKKYMQDLNNLKDYIKERQENTFVLKNNLDETYEEIPGTRLPNSLKRF